jgi:hypothetical protein
VCAGGFLTETSLTGVGVGEGDLLGGVWGSRMMDSQQGRREPDEKRGGGDV